MFVGRGLFQGGELAVQQRGRHEMALALFHAVADQLARTVQQDEMHLAMDLAAQAVAINALERRAGHHHAMAGRRAPLPCARRSPPARASGLHRSGECRSPSFSHWRRDAANRPRQKARPVSRRDGWPSVVLPEPATPITTISGFSSVCIMRNPDRHNAQAHPFLPMVFSVAADTIVPAAQSHSENRKNRGKNEGGSTSWRLVPGSLLAGTAQAGTVKSDVYGVMKNGATVHVFTMTNNHGMRPRCWIWAASSATWKRPAATARWPM